MSTEDVIYEEKGRCAWLTMNRPEAKNALSKKMFRDLTKSLSKAILNKAIRYVVITGARDSFSAGLDIKQVGSFASLLEAKDFVYKLVKPFWKMLLNCDKPVLAVVDGPAYGAGAEIVLAADIVVASSRSKFAFSGGRVGALCCISGVIGPMVMDGRKVIEMNLTGNALSAEDAKEAGLVTQVTPEAESGNTITEIVEKLEQISPISNSSFKRIRRGMIPEQALELAYRQLFRTITSPDFSKGANAFLHKQTPNY